MTVKNFVNFYDNKLKGSNNSVSTPNCKIALTDQINAIDTFWKSQSFITSKRAESFKKAGNECVQKGQYKEAVGFYKKALAINPEYVDVYFNLAKAYKNINDLSNAIETYDKLLLLSPQDIEAITYAGECHKELKHYTEASKLFKKAINIDPNFDLAKRLLLETDNLKLSLLNPQKAVQEKEIRKNETLKKAIELTIDFLPKEVSESLKGIKIVFDNTESMSGHQNIAQYENDKKQITVCNKYIWASPEVVAAYLCHEAIHAKDRDPYTSIKEEQNAYEEAIKFWIQNNNRIKDPEMDYAASLYLISKEKLDQKVAEVYSSRDESIPQFSPNHGIAAVKFFFSKMTSAFTELFTSNELKATPQLSYDKGLLKNYCR